MSGELRVPEPLAPLEELYSCVLSAHRPSLTPARSACLLRSCLYARGGGGAPEPGCEAELQCVSLTVLEQLLCRLTERRGGPEFHLFAEETWSLLQAEVMDAVLQQLHSEDLLLSHLSVMCASAAVIHQLHQTGLVCGEWSQWCVQTLRCPPGAPGDACVRSVTEVLRRLLKGAHYELAEKVVVEFGSSLSVVVPRWLSAAVAGSSVCLVVELLEVVCACRGGSCLLSVCSVDLLALCSSAEPMLRRRALLLLKTALVQRAEEDVFPLANIILRAAAEGGLRGVPLEGAAYFGGTRSSPPGPRVDGVSLRALGLVLLKSMELQCRTSGSVSQAEPVPLAPCLQSLWDTLLPVDSAAPSSGQPRHCCSRLSSVFVEQDDDMMEAAKALLCIFLHHRRQELAQSSLLLWACPLGLNPHCHFLLLLRSLAFDHRVLLDFLISTETCFLEYFVRYLRLLRTDPEGFSAACSSVCLEPRGGEGHRGSKGTGDPGAVAGGAGQGRGVLLVDYSSSEESDTEEVERTVGCERAQRRDCLEAAVHCLFLLQELVSRLHKKKLFPYNPSSLIKLLTETEAGLKSVSTA